MKIDFTGNSPGFDYDDPEILLDEHQRKALRFDREIIVSAGAGSGKTSTLSLRYTRLLVECAWIAARDNRADCPIEQVLVLTFTDKAAQEMAERCERQFRSYAEAAHREKEAILQHWDAQQGTRFLEHIDSLIEQFSRARISTFHSFYTALLREHALYAGLSPGFRLAEELQRRELFRKVARSAFDSWRTDMTEPLYREFAHDLGGRRGIEDALVKLLGERSKFRGHAAAWEAPGRLLSELVEESPLTPTDVERWLTQEVKPVLSSLAEYLAPGGKPIATAVSQLNKQFSPLPESVLGRNRIARQVFEVLFREDKPRALSKGTSLGGKAKWKEAGCEHLLEDYRQGVQSLEPTIASWLGLQQEVAGLPTEVDERADRGAAALWSLYGIAKRELADAFSAQQLEDFDGIELRVAQLLADDPEFSGTVASSIRYVMVDEFQDTNALQWEILQHLARPRGVKSDRLFAVGDLKQAIYSFRGGDVTVFSEAMASIASEVQLEFNYRSTPAIVSFNNRLFASLMGSHRGDRPPWEAHYTTSEAGRTWENPGEVAAFSYESVSAKKNADLEARLIAQQCRRLLSSEGPYRDYQFGSPEVHPESPIAILLRKRTHLTAFQEALAEAGISCRVVKGVGFWRRREVLDLLLALQAGIRGDATSVVGFLRSPLACVSDRTIQALSDGHFGATHRNFLHAALTAEAPPELQRAQRTLRRVSSLAPNRSLRALAEEILQSCTAHHAWALNMELPEAEANVLKILQLCTEYGNQGWSHGRILEVFEQESQNLVREKEADVSGSQARVLIQTVHSAKGLQFPVVFLPSLGSETSIHDTLSIGRANGQWAAAYKAQDPAALNQTKVAPVRHQQIAERRRAEEQAESLRKLYVATTRAESHLYFVGPFDKPKANSWASWVKPSVGTEWGPALIDLTEAPRPESAPSASVPSADISAMTGFSAIDWAPEIRLTPSSIRLYQSCPVCWKLAQTYGNQRPLSSHRDHARDAAARRGDLLHELLDQRRLDPNAGIQKWRSMARLHPWPASIVAKQEKRLQSDLSTLSKSPVLAEIFQGEAHSEPGFEITHGSTCLHGRIDLLWRDGPSWVLIDFKSEDLAKNPHREAEHRDQLTAYAWAASKILNEPVFRVELFGTRDAQRYPLAPLSEQDFLNFESLIESIEADSRRPIAALKLRVRSDPAHRPCDTCSDHNSLDKGQKP